jgi:undecaprenyl-diphosphatase
MENLLDINRKLFLIINGTFHSSLTDSVMFVITQFGTGLVMAALIGVPLFFYDRENFVRRFLIIVIAVAFGGVLVIIIKDLVSYPRPINDLMGLIATGSVKVHVFIEDSRHNSFPSGHTQLAFGAVIALSWYHRGWFTIPLFLLATLVGISRVYLGVHFPLDVIAGAFLGGVASVLICWGGDRIFSRSSEVEG